MGWAHPAVAVEELIGLVRGFVDLLVLAGGRTSSGAAANWSCGEVKNALRWALFFEEVFKDLRDSGHYEDSARELDAALAELTSSPDFPKGLAGMRSDTLSSARPLVIQHFLKTKTSGENLVALLEAVVEMDIDSIHATGVRAACQEYVKMISDMDLSSLTPTRNPCKVGLSSSDEPYAKSMLTDHSLILVKELLKGLDSASRVSLAERGLDTLLKSVEKNSSDDARDNPFAQAIPKKSQMIGEFLLWKKWRANSLSYFLDERTIQIMSGASLIFGAPREQWIRVFEPLKSCPESYQIGLVEIMELCLLGLVSRRWNVLMEGIMSCAFDFVPISKQYVDLHQFLQRAQEECHDNRLNSEEQDIIEYARQLLQSKPDVLWLLPPVLTAAAIRPRSALVNIYLAEIDKKYHETAPANRKCTCRGDGMDQHHNCEIAERIQWLYTFHVQQLLQ